MRWRTRSFCSFERKSSFLVSASWSSGSRPTLNSSSRWFESCLERECFWHLWMLSTLELENGCVQHKPGAGGGGGLAGIAQWER